MDRRGDIISTGTFILWRFVIRQALLVPAGARLLIGDPVKPGLDQWGTIPKSCETNHAFFRTDFGNWCATFHHT